MNAIFKYFLILPFSNNNQNFYLSLFYFFIIINFIILIIILYAFYYFMKKEKNIKLSLKFLKYILPFVTNTLFLPIFFSFISIFNYSEKKIKFYTFNMILSIINILLFIPISLFTVKIFYNYSLGDEKNIISKNTSIPDIFFLFEKILITIFFNIYKGKQHLVLIIVLVSFSFISVYLNFKYERYNKKTINFMHKFLSLTFFWSSFCLFIGKITIKTNFNSSLGIFLAIEPIFFIIIFSQKENFNNFLLIIGKEKNINENIFHIRNYLYIIDKIDIKRKHKLKLQSYIEIFEENCIAKDCPLKRYLQLLKLKINSTINLLQHAKLLYLHTLSKYPENIEIKIAYSLFLLTKLRKRNQALEFLSTINLKSLSIEQQFNIYRCKKIFEDNLSDLREEEKNNNKIIQNLKYKNYFKYFMTLINETTSLYIDFWNQLLNSYNTGKKDLNRLNNCGTKICNLINEIKNTYYEMKKIKLNDFHSIKIYYKFISEILSDKKEKQKLQIYMNNIDEEIGKEKIEEFENIDIKNLNKNDCYIYIIVSTKPENFGSILNASLSISEIFGYKKNDLINQNLNIIIPDIFHKEHIKLLNKKLNQFQKEDYNDEINKKKKIREINTFGLTKSKYLIEINMKIILYQSEYFDQYYISSFSKEVSFFNTNNEKDKEEKCYVLTDLNLIIQNFTANSAYLLNIKSDMIDNNIEITYYIQQLYDEFLKTYNENKDITFEQKMILKRKILIDKFSTPSLIAWNNMKFNDSFYYSTRIVDILQRHNNSTINRGNDFHQKLLYLTAKEEIINNKVLGFLFIFEKVDNKIISSEINKQSILNKITNSIITNNSIDISKEKLNITPNFIPDSNLSLLLDTNSFSFKITDNINHFNSITDYAKKKIYSKITLENEYKKINEDEDNEESNEENDEESEEESDEESDEEKNDEKDDKKNREYNKEKNEEKNNTMIKKEEIRLIDNYNNDINYIKSGNDKKNIKNNQIDNYYKINFSRIKLLIYNYNNNNFEEINNYEKISQVEKKLTKYPKSKKEEVQNFEEIRITKIINDSNDLNLEKENLSYDKDSFLIQQIEKHIKKKESKDDILKLYFYSLLNFIILIIFSIISLIYILKGIDIVKKCCKLLNNSNHIIVMNSIGIYYVRELTLIYNENYTNYPSKENRSDYLNSTINHLNEVFELLDKSIAENIEISLNFNKKTEYELVEKNYNIYHIKNDLSIIQTRANFHSILIETSNDIYNICHNILTEFIPTNPYIYHYIYNILNSIGRDFYNQILIYLDEIDYQTKNIKIICIIGIIVIYIFLIFIYFSIGNAYKLILEKKENYIHVFYDIKINDIKNFLDKCEKFYKILNEKDNEINEEEKDIDKNINISIENINKTESKPLNKRKNIKKKTINKTNQSSKIFFLNLIIFLSIIAIYYIICLLLYLKYLNQSCINENFLYQETVCENEYYLLYNALREAYFDEKSNFYGINVEEFLQSELEYAYVIRKKANIYLDIYRPGFPSNFIVYDAEIKKNTPCDFQLNDYFLTFQECDDFQNNSTKYGLDLLASYFIEEIRFIDQIRRGLTEHMINRNNLTLEGTALYNEKWPNDKSELELYIKNDPITLINMDIVRNLNIYYRNFMIPLYTLIRFLTIDCIDKYNKRITFFFILIFGIFFCCLLCFFILYWVLFIKSLQQMIYGTKKILNLIPSKVLKDLPEIFKLFGIEIEEKEDKLFV